MTGRARGYEVHPYPSTRRLVTAGLRAGRRMAPMIGLIDVDVTRANALLSAHDPPLSMTAFVVASVARAAVAHPSVHAYRDWRGRLVTHRHVDVVTLIEVPTAQGRFGLAHVVRDADARTVADVSAELHSVKSHPGASTGGRWLERAAPVGARIPGMVRAMYLAMSRSIAARQRVGTVAVSAVGMFAGGPGFGVTPMSLMSLEVVVGGMSLRPRVVDGEVHVRDVLDLTVQIDHNVVDGAPAARFGAALRELIETAAVLC